MGRKPLEKVADETFSFRLSAKEKSAITKRLSGLREKFNKQCSESEYKITKNDVIISALKKGLESIEYEDLPKRNKRKKSY